VEQLIALPTSESAVCVFDRFRFKKKKKYGFRIPSTIRTYSHSHMGLSTLLESPRLNFFSELAREENLIIGVLGGKVKLVREHINK
jgi:hypothetical protein